MPSDACQQPYRGYSKPAEVLVNALTEYFLGLLSACGKACVDEGHAEERGGSEAESLRGRERYRRPQNAILLHMRNWIWLKA